MCPKNGTIFMLGVTEMGLFIFCLVYVYIDNNINFVESTPWWGIWRRFCSELFLYFKDSGFYINTDRGILV